MYMLCNTRNISHLHRPDAVVIIKCQLLQQVAEIITMCIRGFDTKGSKCVALAFQLRSSVSLYSMCTKF